MRVVINDKSFTKLFDKIDQFINTNRKQSVSFELEFLRRYISTDDSPKPKAFLKM